MNYLAHAVLSGPEPEWVVGGYLGDHVRGGAWRDYPRGMAEGILLHRRIDAQVDQHPVFVEARARLRPPFRRFAGIILDMYFDHCLARRWGDLGQGSLEGFAEGQYRLLRKHWPLLPESLKRFAGHMESHNLLVGYRDPDAVQRALAGVGTRINRDNPLHRAMAHLEDQSEQLAADFEILWPDMVEYAAGQRALLVE